MPWSLLPQSLTQPMTRPLFEGPTPWPGVEHAGPLGRARGGAYTDTGHPQECARTQAARKLASETQKNQKVGSRYHRHEAPETRKWRQPVLQTGSFVSDSCGADVGDLSHVLDWLARCSCSFQTIQFLGRLSLVLVNYKCLACQLGLKKNSFDLMCFVRACKRL